MWKLLRFVLFLNFQPNTLILDIFAQRALSKEGKLQVELAQLNYRLPRLYGMGGQMSRTGAGIGTRGPGEQKLEIDKRTNYKDYNYKTSRTYRRKLWSGIRHGLFR